MLYVQNPVGAQIKGSQGKNMEIKVILVMENREWKPIQG